MGKKAQRRSSIPEKDNASWIQSFVSIFEFSQSYNLRKLLTVRKHRSARIGGTHFSGSNLTEDTLERKYEHDKKFDGCKDTMVLSRLPSVKSLIEEEMSIEKTSMASVWNVKSNQKMIKNHKTDSDHRFNHLMESAYEGSNLILDLAALMTEFYSVSNCSNLFGVDLFGSLRSNGQQKNTNFDESASQLAYKNSMLLEALVGEAEAFLSQKIDETKQLVGNGVIHAQEFMDALEILNSNKELFLKLVQHPNSLVFSHIQQLLKSHIADSSKLEAVHYLEGSDHSKEKNEISDPNGKIFSNQMIQKQKKHFFLKKKDKFHEETASKIRNSSKEISKIVVLTPHLPRNHDDSIQTSPCSSPQSCYSKKHEKSHFSFREIKRKLKYIISDSRKEQHLISKDSFSRIPVGCKGSTKKYSMKPEEGNRKEFTTQAVPFNSKAESRTNSKECQQKVEAEATRCKIQGLSPVSLFHAESFNEESEKYFSEMISTDCSTANSTNNQISNPLEELISPSDCNQLKLLLIDDSSANLTPEQSSKEETCDGDQPNTDGREEIVDVEKVKFVHVNSAECNTLYIPDACSSCESCTGGCSEQGTPNEKPRMLISTASISPNSLIIKHVDSSEFMVEKPERPSPVSVLEPFLLEEDTSPDHSSIKLDSFTTDELHNPLQPIHLNFHEDSEVLITTSDCLISHQRICSYDMEMMTKFVKTVLESNNFDSEMSLESLPSLSDEIRSLQSSYPEDPKLLLDCVNEVLSEIRARRFQIFSPWLSFLKPTIVQPFLKDFIIKEVSKTIMSYAVSSQVQPTINEIVRKDMDSTMWMDYRLEMEHIIAEVCCYIFEELMEETII